MLRIKAEKWNEFCEKAESLGFNKTKDSYGINEYFSYGNLDICAVWGFISICGKDVSGLAEIMLFDLITLGYVEKVEEQ